MRKWNLSAAYVGWEADAAHMGGPNMESYQWIRVVQDDWEYTERVQAFEA